ncbi:MAG: RNA methyltransferase [Lachnospiraceae bacterium]|nr:RNA methyltransferase [Lachnospiraceae bacterium]
MITSTSSKQVKNLILLGKKPKERRGQQVFLAEGKKMFLEAPKELLKKVYVSESFFEIKENKSLVEQADYEVLKDSVFQAVSDTKTPQGILSVISMPKWDKEQLLKKQDGFFLLLEGIQDPGNLGTMLRTAEGAGITAVIANKTTVDLYNPKTIRSTMGSIFRVPFLTADNFYGVMAELKKHSVKIYAAHLEGSVSCYEPDYKGSVGFLMGNEGNGLTREAAALADTCIKIPMEGEVESLNAAVAAAILMYEANRQRKG